MGELGGEDTQMQGGCEDLVEGQGDVEEVARIQGGCGERG